MLLAAGLTLVFGAAAASVGVDIELRRAGSPPAISLSDAGSTAARRRLAQAGSTGGTLGKKDQSLSGGKASDDRPGRKERRRPSYALSGNWEYTQTCQVGSYRGSMRISQTGANSFRGTVHQESPKISADILDGVISGNKVSFKATFSSLETWRGSLTGPGRMQGKVSTGAVGDCTWRAARH